MNKFEFAFLKSHIKKAIWNLECANKLKPGKVNKELIVELKVILQNLEDEGE